MPLIAGYFLINGQPAFLSASICASICAVRPTLLGFALCELVTRQDRWPELGYLAERLLSWHSTTIDTQQSEAIFGELMHFCRAGERQIARNAGAACWRLGGAGLHLSFYLIGWRGISYIVRDANNFCGGLCLFRVGAG